MDLIRRLAAATWLHVAVAFALMGGWAAYANRAHPDPAPLLAGLTQGALSAALTFGLKRGVDALSARLSGWILPPALALAASATLLVGVHLAAGTPEVAATVAVPLGVSGVYVFAYAFLSRGARA